MEVGRIIGGKYRVVHEIGAGAMGCVWAGKHELLGRGVAIKFMQPALEDAATASARFVAEAKAAAQLKHRFIVDVFDFGITDDGQYYMVQELLDGAALAEVLHHGPAWPVAEVVRFAAQCLSGLQAVHASGIVHRDLKPENIFVQHDAEGRFPKLLDFGISKSASSTLERTTAKNLRRPSLRAGRALTAVGAAPGTPAYMSPEQLQNKSDLDGRADLYSMGVVLYEWLSGRLPYPSTSDFALLHAQIEVRSMTPLERLRPDLGAPLCQVVARALAFDANERFRSAAEMREALLACADDVSIAVSVVQDEARIGHETRVLLESASDPFNESDETRFLPRFPLLRVLGGGGALLALGLASWLALNGEPESAKPEPAPTPTTTRVAASAASYPPPPSAPLHAAAPEPAHVVEAELPIGADLPEEELPVSLPVSSSAKSAHAREKRHTRAASKPTKPAPTPAQKVALSSSPAPARPIRQKVVRQLDF